MLELVLISTAAFATMLLLPGREIRRPEEGRRQARALLRARQTERRGLDDLMAVKVASARERVPPAIRSRRTAAGVGGALLAVGILAGAGLGPGSGAERPAGDAACAGDGDAVPLVAAIRAECPTEAAEPPGPPVLPRT